jgi:hypothetical protein
MVASSMSSMVPPSFLSLKSLSPNARDTANSPITRLARKEGRDGGKGRRVGKEGKGKKGKGRRGGIPLNTDRNLTPPSPPLIKATQNRTSLLQASVGGN